MLNRLTSESQTGNTLTTVYDALSRVRSVQSSVLGTVTYTPDAAGRRARTDYPDGFYVTYSHNTAGELTGIFENGGTSLATYAYDNLGRRTSLTRGNGVVTSYTFDSVSRLGTLEQDSAGTTHDTTFAFNYNPASQITSRTRTNAVYDWVLPASSNQSYTPDGLNRCTNALGVTPTYDTRGNLTGDGTKTYSYDYDNRMISASGGVTLGYDPLGRLHEVAGGGATTQFLYDGADVIAEYDGATVLKRYVHGPGADEPLVAYEGSGTSNRSWLLGDERGSVIGTTNNSGNVTQINTYDVYGVPGAANDGSFQYTGQMWIGEIGLYYYKARAYHPRLGRFMQTDPISYAGGMNLYSYVDNDPVNRADPSGLCWELVPQFAWSFVTAIDENGNEDTTSKPYTRYVWECISAMGGAGAELSQSGGVHGLGTGGTLSANVDPQTNAWSGGALSVSLAARVGEFVGGGFSGKPGLTLASSAVLCPQ